MAKSWSSRFCPVGGTCIRGCLGVCLRLEQGRRGAHELDVLLKAPSAEAQASIDTNEARRWMDRVRLLEARQALARAVLDGKLDELVRFAEMTSVQRLAEGFGAWLSGRKGPR